ncbi:MAG: AraC family transcriptional regulator [Prevotella sp.]|nr:AraC family transcriptional regulator [Prevotella sp.]
MPTEPRRMNFILIGLCTQGEVMYQLDTQEQIIKAGDILIVSDRHVVDSYQHSPDMKGLCMMVSVNFYREIIQNVSDVSSLFLFSRQHPVMSLEQREIDTFKEYFQVIKQKISDEGNHFRKDLIKTLLLAMFYDLSNIIYRVRQDDKPQTRAEIIFTKFIKLVEQNFRQERRVSWYAQQLCITPKYLSETVKSASQRTPNEWIDDYVLLELRVQLKNSTKNIKEIADELHFPNQSFLGKFFKEHVGMSPSEYRKSGI